MTFTIHSTRDGKSVETHRISPVIAVAKGREMVKSGWQVHITDSMGKQFPPSEFDQLLSFDRGR